MNVQCPHCNKNLNGAKSLYGHYAHCTFRPKVEELRYLIQQEDYIEEDNAPLEDYMAVGIPPEFEDAYSFYLQKQRKYLSMENIAFLESGHVALLEGTREKADI